MSEVKKYNTWAHSWVSNANGNNVIGVKEKIIIEHPDGSTTYEDNLRMFNDPQRPFWITKPEYRDHAYKKEFEMLNKCDMYTCHDSELPYKVAAALGKFIGKNYRPNIRQLCNSPFVYGADMDVETLIKQHYTKNTPPGKVAKYSLGALDIENETKGAGRITLITYMHERDIYTGILQDYTQGEDLDKFQEVIDREIGDLIRENNFKLNMKICDTEVDLIRWIFEQIHRCKTDFIGIWNISYDFPKIIERLVANGVSPESIMCHPDIPDEIKFVKWKEDNTPVDHFTDSWHWATVAGYTQFIDLQNLYARLRKVHGRDSSYSLDYIAMKELKQEKLHFSPITNHWHMLNNQFKEYTAYNIKDVMLLMLLLFKNNDVASLCGLVQFSLLSQFSKQTVMVRNFAYVYAKEHNRIPASAGIGMFTEYDLMIKKPGGTVLAPNKAVGVFIPVLGDMSHSRSMVSIHDNDLDFSGLYPTIKGAFNISKETMLASVIGINGFDDKAMEYLFSCAQRPEVNAVSIGHTFYGLNNYTEMIDSYKQHIGMAA